MQTVSLLWGIMAMIGVAVFSLPFLGAFNWFNIPFSGLGLIIGIVAVLVSPDRKNRIMALFGTLFCALAMIVGIIRLMVGFGMI